MNSSPPLLAVRFLRWFCRKDLCYHIEGDLQEFYELNVSEKGIRIAGVLYWIEVIRLFRPELIGLFHRKQKLKLTNMTTHYFKLAFRRLLRNGKASLTSISGVSIGLIATFLMLFYIQYETSYDSFNRNYNNSYMIERTLQNSRIDEIYDKVPYPLAAEIMNRVPGITAIANTTRTGSYIQYDGQQFYEENGLIADQAFTDIFDLDLVSGNKKTLLISPSAIVISESLSKKIDPYGPVTGKTIRLNKKHDFIVTGVFRDRPANSHLNIDYLLPFSAFPILKDFDPSNNWTSNVSSTYLTVQDGSDASAINGKIHDLLSNFAADNQGFTESLSLRPVSDIYLYTSKVKGGNGRRSEITIIYLFIGVVLFTIVVTALNYINSTVAQTLAREKEMGIKKVMGSAGTDLALQFFAEAATLLITSLIIAITVSLLLLPVFGEIVDRDLQFILSSHWPFLLKIIGFTLFIGCLAGIYPVLYLSRLRLSSFLQGMSSLNRKNRLRKVLVVFQLVISIPLIFSSIIVSEQIGYLKNRDIGFNKNNLLRSAISSDKLSEEKINTLRNSLLAIPGVTECSFSTTAPFYSANALDVFPDDSDSEEKFRLRTHQADHQFVNTYRMEMVEGRSFSKNHSYEDSKAIIINETTRKLFGWDKAVGKRLNNGKYHVIGVVKDFNDFTLFKKIRAMAIVLREQDPKNIYVSIRVKDENYEMAKTINTLFNDAFPEDPIHFSYLSSRFDTGYLNSLSNVSDMFIFFSILAVMLCGIGLHNLVSYSARSQQKMIAIRKVLGAGVNRLSFLMLKEYLLMYAIAAIVGLTASYFTASFAFNVLPYHVGIKASYFIIAGLTVLLVVITSVMLKISSTVSANPVDAIGNE